MANDQPLASNEEMRVGIATTSTAQDRHRAQQMLERTRELLDNGRRWQAKKLATTRFGRACDPCSTRAHSFSLVGAALRARSEFPELSEPRAGDTFRLVEVLQGLATPPGGSYRGERDWKHAESILLGLAAALAEPVIAESRHETSLPA